GKFSPFFLSHLTSNWNRRIPLFFTLLEKINEPLFGCSKRNRFFFGIVIGIKRLILTFLNDSIKTMVFYFTDCIFGDRNNSRQKIALKKVTIFFGKLFPDHINVSGGGSGSRRGNATS